MNFVLCLAIIVTLAFVAYQDFKSREVWIWFFVLLLVESIVFVASKLHYKSLLIFSGINIGIIAFQYLCLTLFFSLKNKKLTSIVNTYIGVGDLVFFVITALWFSPFNFTCFILASLFIGLFSFIFIKRNNIPLAGLMSLALCFVLGFQLITKVDLYNDYYLIDLLGLR